MATDTAATTDNKNEKGHKGDASDASAEASRKALSEQSPKTGVKQSDSPSSAAADKHLPPLTISGDKDGSATPTRQPSDGRPNGNGADGRGSDAHAPGDRPRTGDRLNGRVAVNDQTQPAKTGPTLDQATLDKTAQELHDAIQRRNSLKFWDPNNPDKEKIQRLLEPLSAADRRALEKTYHDKFDASGPSDTLRNELRDKLGGNDSADFRRAEATLNRVDNRTNDAGTLMTAIAHAKDDKEKGSAEVRNVFETLNSKQIAQLDSDFRSAYGMSYQEALDKANLTDSTKAALPLLEKGVDNKTPGDVMSLANIALDKHDPMLFGEALRGDSPAATQARQQLQQDEGFKSKMAEAFPSDAATNLAMNWGDPKQLPWEQQVDQTAIDYLKEGRISLSTITSENTGKWVLDNKENIELAARNASPKERADYSAGRDLSLSGRTPNNPADQAALDYYNKVHDAFNKGGNAREVSIWEDQLIHGRETIISQLAKGHSDGWGPLGWGSGHSMQDLMSKAENLSPEDYKLLHNQNTGPAFRRELESSLAYADPGERARIMDLIDRKAAAGSPEAAAAIHRSLGEVVSDNKGSKFLGLGTSYDGKNILDNITTMSPQDAQRYKTDKTFHDSVDNFVRDYMGDEQRLLAQRLLQKVGDTGTKPQMDAVDKLLNDKIHGAKSEQLLSDSEAALKDPALRARLSLPDGQLSEDEKTIKRNIDNALSESFMKSSGYSPDTADYSKLQQYQQELYGKGELSLQSKLDLGFDKSALIPAIAKASPAERDSVIKSLSPQEQEIVRAAAQRGGELSLADKMRLYAIGDGGDPSEIRAGLTQLQQQKDYKALQALKNEYSQSYHADADSDFLGKLKDDPNFGKDVSQYKQLLTPGQSDGRQQFYDNFSKALDSLGTGVSADGSSDTVRRALDENANQLEAYQRIYQTLPKEKQEALDKYFNDSLDQYKQSKEKLAELASTVVITAAALAATPFTGGASLALVGSLAFAAGGVTKVLLHRAIEGGDYDWNKALGQFATGGTDAALNFIGGNIASKMFKGFNVVGEDLGKTLVGKGLVLSGSESFTGKAFTELIAQGKNVTQEGLETFVRTVAPGVNDFEAAAIKKLAQEAVLANYDAVVNRVARVALSGLDNAIIGGAASDASLVVNAVANGQHLSAKDLIETGLTGAATGAVVGTLVHGAIEGRDVIVKAKASADVLPNINKGNGLGPGMDAKIPGGQITVSNALDNGAVEIKFAKTKPDGPDLYYKTPGSPDWEKFSPGDYYYGKDLANGTELRIGGPNGQEIKIAYPEKLAPPNVDEVNAKLPPGIPGVSGTPTYSRMDGGGWKFSVQTADGHGSVTIGRDGSVLYYDGVRQSSAKYDANQRLISTANLKSDVTHEFTYTNTGELAGANLKNGYKIDREPGSSDFKLTSTHGEVAKEIPTRYSDVSTDALGNITAKTADGQVVRFKVDGDVTLNNKWVEGPLQPVIDKFEREGYVRYADQSPEIQEKVSARPSDAMDDRFRRTMDYFPEVSDPVENLRLNQYVDEIYSKYSPRSVGKSEFTDIVNSFPEPDRKLALALLDGSASNASADALANRFKKAAIEIQKNSWAGGVNIFTISNDSSGNMLGYLMKKGTKTETAIRSLDDLVAGRVSTPDPIVLFEDPSRLNLTSEQKAFLSTKRVTVIDPGGFEKGVNVIDTALGGDAVKDKLTPLMKEASAYAAAHPELSPQQVAEYVLHGNGSEKLAAELPNAKVIRLDDGTIGGALNIDNVYNNFQPVKGDRQKIANFIRDYSKGNPELLARFLADGSSFVSFPALIQKTEQLNNQVNKLLADLKKTPDDLYVITDADPGGSSHLSSYLYSKTSGVRPDHFITTEQAREMIANGSAKGKLVMYLDDTTYSGSQVTGQARNHPEWSEFDGTIYGVLGAYDKAVGKIIKDIPNLRNGKTRLLVVDRDLDALHNEWFQNLTPDEQRKFREMVGYEGFGDVYAAKGLAYISPDNNIGVYDKFLKEVLDLPGPSS